MQALMVDLGCPLVLLMLFSERNCIIIFVFICCRVTDAVKEKHNQNLLACEGLCRNDVEMIILARPPGYR